MSGNRSLQPGPSWQPAGNAGVSGVLGGYQSKDHLAAALSAFFLPASLALAPGATTSSVGGRQVVLTNRTGVMSVNGQSGNVTLTTPPIEVILAALVAGAYTWTYAAPFKSPPAVFCFPIGTPPTKSFATTPAVTVWAELYSGTPAANSVVITSTVNTDTRQIMLVAIGNPN